MNISDLYNAASGLIRRIGNDYQQYLFGGIGFEQTVGRPPYRHALARNDGGFRFYGGGHNKSILFELTGRGCAGLDGYEVSTGFIQPFAESLTRLDFASDVRSDTLPGMFANKRSHQGFRAVSFIRSGTGETAYVGSAKSDRFARVYRYNKPHPRHELLRIEHVFRRGLAKSAYQTLVDASSFEAFAAQVGNTWGWQHPDWQPGHVTDERVTTPKIDRSDEDTIAWLYKQVAPAVARLWRSGALDMDDWISHALKQGDEDPAAHVEF